MKLRNKKTGQIVELDHSSMHYSYHYDYGENARGEQPCSTWNHSLAELNEEWEDYEEPKMSYFINWFGEVSELSGYISDKEIKKLKEIGNYFETKEEAEKAVEKLKAWKRLKNKGLTFCAWKITDDGCSVDVETTLDAEIVRAQQKCITDDLDLLFGGEE